MLPCSIVKWNVVTIFCLHVSGYSNFKASCQFCNETKMINFENELLINNTNSTEGTCKISLSTTLQRPVVFRISQVSEDCSAQYILDSFNYTYKYCNQTKNGKEVVTLVTFTSSLAPNLTISYSGNATLDLTVAGKLMLYLLFK